MKRSVAILLALLMVLSAAVPAFAQEGEVSPDGNAPLGGVVSPGISDGTPAPEQSAAPAPEQNTAPAPEQNTAPAPEQSAAPAPEQSAAPAPEQSAAPAPEQNTAPAPEQNTAPAPEQSATPAPEESVEPSPEESAEPSLEPTATPEPTPGISLISAVPIPVGQVDVSIVLGQDIGALTPVFTVQLSNETWSDAREAAADGQMHSFANLMPGTYTLTVKAAGFVTYEQIIEVGPSDGIILRLTVGKLAGYGSDSRSHYGVLLIGDVDGDGDLDGDDRLYMMQCVAAGASLNGWFTDLNGDGVTNLADAEYLAKSWGWRAENIQSTEERYVPAAAIGVGTAADTFASGDVSNLFADNAETFTLSRTDGTEISASAPVQMEFAMEAGATTDVIVLDQTNITSGEMVVEFADGTFGSYTIGDYEPVAAAIAPVAENVPPEDTGANGDAGIATIAAVPLFTLPIGGGSTGHTVAPPSMGHADPSGGNITVKLGGQKAVKRVTLRITGTESGTLASITQVEFVNGMEDRIPEPALDIPTNVKTVAGSGEFTVSWDGQVNVTGYQVLITGGGLEEIVPLSGTSLTVTSIVNGDRREDVLNYTEYTVCVQSVNGTWSSDWSEKETVTPQPTGRPDKPDNVKATGGYGTVSVSWKKMKDTVSYNLYYKEESAAEFTKIPKLEVTSFVISGLDSSKPTTYVVYVTGENPLGESEPSAQAAATTATLDPPQMPQFNLINRDASGKPGPYHISAAQCVGTMVASPMDTAPGTAWGTVDGDAASYYERATWDDGGYNNLNTSIGLTYTFDAAYTMDTIGMMYAESSMDFTYAKVRWWDAQGGEHFIDRDQMSTERRTDANGKIYFFLRLPEPIEASKVQIGTARYWAGNNRIAVSEVYFYKYDSLKRELMDLYADDLHMTLKEGVTEQQLNELKGRIETSADEFGNANPDKDSLLKEWQTAWDILQLQLTCKVTQVHCGITPSGDEHGFGGLNGWQPLGVVAAAGDRITVYVGGKTLKTGANTDLQLVFTQYHADSGSVSKTYETRLKIGPNEIQVPKIWTTTGVESGGALYVQYTGGATEEDLYAVRVNGGVQVPVLDLYKVTDPGTRSSRTAAYVSELQAYVADIESKHAQYHQGESASREVNYPFSNSSCILGATDIMLDTMLMSLPAQQVVAGCGGNAGTLLGSLNAMENMMGLFYQHKGLNAAAPDEIDRIPRRHLNIRYQQMFSGAFMYAAGDHIGIEWNETAGMASCGGVVTDASGRYVDGNYFGWGIPHEIGHDINQGTYAIAEITNNYFSVLAQARDNNASVRFEYPKVYEKVTSGTKGSASNVFTQLGMYWQLHLAYDTGYNFRTYADYGEQFANLFWARVDTYARTPAKAPGGLTLDGADGDQKLMRLCCAAAGKNILDFFQRWGKTPDEATIAYASQFPAETRAIYYVCDDSRAYTIANGGSGKLTADGTTEAIGAVTVTADPDQANRIDLTMAPNGVLGADEVLGYEIVRCTIADGAVEKKTVGFTTDGSFEDVVYAMNNRAVYYEVTLVDQYLNRSAPVTTEMVKVHHEGDLAKTHWTVATTGLEAAPITTEGTMDDPEGTSEDAATLMVDGKVASVYEARVTADGAAIELDFHENQVITGFRYTAGEGAPIGGYTVEVRQNGEWLRVDEGTLGGTRTVYFSNANRDYVSTYAADALRLTLAGQTGETISVAELDVLGLSGDNVEFGEIGYLSTSFTYGDKPEDVIPAGSLVFTGTYKGNPAYNVVMLFDGSGSVVAGRAADGSLVAYQTILAHVPDEGELQNVNKGTWIYWIEPDDMLAENGFALPAKVRAELYRVNNAQTNEGERLVSDTLFTDMPAVLGEITLESEG